MNRSAAPWYVSVAESVFALGTAAREYRAAHLAIQATTWHIDPMRVVAVAGSVSVPDNSALLRPHETALWQIGHAYGKLGSRIQELYENAAVAYENAAVAYAHGTAAVLRAVSLGECPRHIRLRRHGDLYAETGRTLPDLQQALGNWTGAKQLAKLRELVQERELAYGVVGELTSFEYLPEHEATALGDASDLAVGLADSAYAYGETAERALHYLLIAARANRTPEEGQR